jgi:hypothetical protein
VNPGESDLWLAEVVRHLTAELITFDSSVVSSVVRTCRQDLQGAPAGALPELVERLARERLRPSPSCGRVEEA